MVGPRDNESAKAYEYRIHAEVLKVLREIRDRLPEPCEHEYRAPPCPACYPAPARGGGERLCDCCSPPSVHPTQSTASDAGHTLRRAHFDNDEDFADYVAEIAAKDREVERLETSPLVRDMSAEIACLRSALAEKQRPGYEVAAEWRDKCRTLEAKIKRLTARVNYRDNVRIPQLRTTIGRLNDDVERLRRERDEAQARLQPMIDTANKERGRADAAESRAAALEAALRTARDDLMTGGETRRMVDAALAGQAEPKAYVTCPKCGPHAAFDEDGCCRGCGSDCENVEPEVAGE